MYVMLQSEVQTISVRAHNHSLHTKYLLAKFDMFLFVMYTEPMPVLCPGAMLQIISFLFL